MIHPVMHCKIERKTQYSIRSVTGGTNDRILLEFSNTEVSCYLHFAV